MKSVFLGNKDVINHVFTDEVKACLQKEAGLNPELVIPADELKNQSAFLRDVDCVFSTWGMPTPDAQTVKELFPGLKRIFFAAGSVQTFARPFFENNVRIHSAWAANGVPVAEYAAAQIVLANKGFFSTSRHQSKGDFAPAREAIDMICGNYDCCVGIIGVGMIGSMVAQRLKNYHIKVLAYDPFLSSKRAEELGVELVTLPELFRRCRTISNHLANNDQTAGMLNKDLFNLMQENVTFINTGRGRQVVEADLIAFLSNHKHATAVLDVSDPEPPVEGSPFYTLDNAILTPHIAGSLGNEVHRMGVYMLEEFRNFSAGKPTKYEVTPEMLETMA